jgi:hypothetical protein
MPPKLPLPRGWKRRVRSFVLDRSISILSLLDSTTNVSIVKRLKGWMGTPIANGRAIARARTLHAPSNMEPG